MATGRSDRIAAVVIFALSAVYTRLAVTFRPFMRTEALGPATFPLLVGGLMLVCSAVLFAGTLRPAPVGAGTRPAPPSPAWRTYLPAFALWALFLGYSLTFDSLGFPVSTAGFVFLAMLLLGVKPWWRALLVTVVFTAAAWYGFVGLGVRLPGGEMFRH